MYQQLRLIVGEENIKIDEPMSKHTTFNIGGAARYFLTVANKAELQASMQAILAEDSQFFIIGKGSNLLVSDSGYAGVIIKLAGEFNGVTIKNNHLIAGTGLSLSALARKAAGQGLSGLEFAEGIPGSVGGAIYMNAGAYGGQISDSVLNITTLNTNTGEVITISRDMCQFAYRHSILMEHPLIALQAIFALKTGNPQEIKTNMQKFRQLRITKQPLKYPSAGSVFKRGADYHASSLIEKAGLKGYSIGGAQVSEMHSGFIINTGKACAMDVYKLIQHIQQVVKSEYQVNLEPEIKFLGVFNDE